MRTSPNRTTAIVVGVLFMIATAASRIASAPEGPVLNVPDYLATASANASQLISGVGSALKK